MATNAAAQWWLRTDGNEANGGGFDSTISGAGTNYADQGSPQVAFSSGNANRLNAATGSTTLTSDGTPFTSAMVGNVICISGGTNFTTGHYWITGYTDSSTVTLDRAPNTSGSAASAGVGRLGGAKRQPVNFAVSNGGGGTGNTVDIGSALVAGNIINVRGQGSNTPTSADYTATSYQQFVNGDSTNGPIKWIGYNGRARVDCAGLAWYSLSYHDFQNMTFVLTGNSFVSNGIVNSGYARVDNCLFDQAGYDAVGVNGAQLVTNCLFTNSGSTAAGTLPAVIPSSYNGFVQGCRFYRWRHVCVQVTTYAVSVMDCVFDQCNSGVVLNGSFNMPAFIDGCTFNRTVNDAVYITDAVLFRSTYIRNCIFSRSGGYGINVAAGSAALIGRLLSGGAIDYNAFYNSTAGHRSTNLPAGAHDVELSTDPFIDESGGDFTLNDLAGGGADLRDAGFPSAFP